MTGFQSLDFHYPMLLGGLYFLLWDANGDVVIDSNVLWGLKDFGSLSIKLGFMAFWSPCWPVRGHQPFSTAGWISLTIMSVLCVAISRSLDRPGEIGKVLCFGILG